MPPLVWCCIPVRWGVCAEAFLGYAGQSFLPVSSARIRPRLVASSIASALLEIADRVAVQFDQQRFLPVAVNKQVVAVVNGSQDGHAVGRFDWERPVDLAGLRVQAVERPPDHHLLA